MMHFDFSLYLGLPTVRNLSGMCGNCKACLGIGIVVVVVVEITLLTSILSGVTWTVAYSEF